MPGPTVPVAGGTELGETLRRHWIPVLPGDVLLRHHTRRVRLLGEDLVCFRDLDGGVGLIGERCPHRGVGLEWGAAADPGLRCPYHHWCFDATGQCIDIPLEGDDLAQLVRLPAYPVRELGGMLFAYLGAGSAPPLPSAPFDNRSALRQIRMGFSDKSWINCFVALGQGDLAESDMKESPTDGQRGDEESAQGPIRGVQLQPPFYAVLLRQDASVLQIHVPIDDAHTALFDYEVDGTLGGDWSGLGEEVPSYEQPLGGTPSGERSRSVGATLEELKRRWLAELGDVDPDVLPTALSALWAMSAGRDRDTIASHTSTLLNGPGRELALAARSRGPAGRAATNSGWDPARDDGLALLEGHCATWMTALGETEDAEALRELTRSEHHEVFDARLVLARSAVNAEARLRTGFAVIQKQTWSQAWPSAWNAESSLRWAEARDMAIGAAWNATWASTGVTLQRCGTLELCRTAPAGAPGLAELSVLSFRLCRAAARAMAWEAAWPVAWAEASAHVGALEGATLEVLASAAADTALAAAVATLRTAPAAIDERPGPA